MKRRFLGASLLFSTSGKPGEGEDAPFNEGLLRKLSMESTFASGFSKLDFAGAAGVKRRVLVASLLFSASRISAGLEVEDEETRRMVR